MSNLLLRNARPWAGPRAARDPRADTILILDGRIALVGSARDASLPPALPVLDAGGRAVLPGLVDAHFHLLSTGFAMAEVQLKDSPSIDDACARVARAAASGDGWLAGAGWDQHLWAGRFPSRLELDAVAPQRPVALAHTSAHALWVNSAALAACGITSETTDPQGGLIDRDVDGLPTGILRDNAMRLVYDRIPPATRQAKREALLRAQAEAHRLGLTGVHAMDVSGGELEALRALHAAGELRLRTRLYLTARGLQRWEGTRTGDCDDRLRIAGVKFFADGALGSLTAWMEEPYEGTENCGLPLQPPAELERDLRWCLERGLAPAVHAIGDRANREVLGIYGRLKEIAPGLPRRIEHAQLLGPGLIQRLLELGVTASVQPIHATRDRAKVDRHWGERGRWAYPFADLVAAGVDLAFGSDSPVESMAPYEGLFAACFRTPWPGDTAPPWYPAQRLDIAEALRGYTAGPARATAEEATFGRLAPGYAGDLVLLDGASLADSFRGPPIATVVAGKVVYAREDFAAARDLLGD